MLVASQTSVLSNPKENPVKKAPMTSRERWIKYDKSPQGKYTKMKRDLRYRIKQKRKRIVELERTI